MDLTRVNGVSSMTQLSLFQWLHHTRQPGDPVLAGHYKNRDYKNSGVRKMVEWKPHVTVAAVVERDGRFLVVEENVEGHIVFNQPAGHVEQGESLLEAVERETVEESGRTFTPEALIGLYSWTNAGNDITYLRFAFTGGVSERDPARKLDEGII